MANWDFLREMDNLRKEIDEAFRGAGYSRPFGSGFLAPLTSSRFPLMNFSEDDDNLYVEALVPGVNPKDIDLSAMKNTVTISGERKPFEAEKGQIVHRSELGSYYRQFSIPEALDNEKAKADFTNGILTLHVPKSGAAKPRKIEIKVG